MKHICIKIRMSFELSVQNKLVVILVTSFQDNIFRLLFYAFGKPIKIEIRMV